MGHRLYLNSLLSIKTWSIKLRVFQSEHGTCHLKTKTVG